MSEKEFRLIIREEVRAIVAEEVRAIVAEEVSRQLEPFKAEVNKRFDRIDERFDEVNKQFEKIAECFRLHDKRLSALENAA